MGIYAIIIIQKLLIRKSSEMPSLTCISVLEQVSYNMVLSVVNKLWLSTSLARTDEYLNLTILLINANSKIILHMYTFFFVTYVYILVKFMFFVLLCMTVTC